MRFFEFKNISNNRKLTEDEEKLESGRMTDKELKKYDRKYVKTIGSSIAQDRTFTFRTKQRTPVPQEYRDSVVRGKIVNGEELLGELEVSPTPAQALAKVRVEGGETIDIPMSTMVKNPVATGEIRFNLGNVAEAVMGSAVSAVFAKGGKTVSRKDALDIAKIVAVNDKYETATPSKDKLDFAVTIPVADTKVFKTFVTEGKEGLSNLEISDDKIKTISKMFDDAVQYVNESQHVQAAVKKAEDDPAENRLKILSDGGNSEKQNTTKVDLEVWLDKEKINLISLKTGAIKQFGQESGSGFEQLDRFFKTSIGFGLPDSLQSEFEGAATEKDKTEVFHNAFSKAYKHIYNELKSQVAGNNDYKEYNLVQAVYKGIKYHATRDEEGVILVILSPTSKKAYQELQFGESLLEAIQGYDLDVELESGKNHIITVTAKAVTKEAAKVDKVAKLVRFRSYLQSGSTGIRNVIEMEALLKSLADLQKLQAKTDAKPKPKAQVEPQSIEEPEPEPQQQNNNDEEEDERSF